MEKHAQTISLALTRFIRTIYFNSHLVLVDDFLCDLESQLLKDVVSDWFGRLIRKVG